MSRIIKEEEAGGFICPIMTKGEDGTPPVMCMGKQCMGWMYSRSKHTEAFANEVIKRVKAKDAKAIKEGSKKRVTWGGEWRGLLDDIAKGKHPGFENTEGYCGLAGDPAATVRA